MGQKLKRVLCFGVYKTMLIKDEHIEKFVTDCIKMSREIGDDIPAEKIAHEFYIKLKEIEMTNVSNNN